MYCDCQGRRNGLKHKYLGNRWPKVSDAEDPSLIIWKNLGIGKIERACRNLTIYLMSLILVVGGFIVISKINEVDDEIKES